MSKSKKIRKSEMSLQPDFTLRRMAVIFIDNIICTLILLFALNYFSLIFVIDFLDPIQNTFDDFYLSDIVFSKIRNNDKVPIDSNIIIVNIGNLSRVGIAREIEKINSYNPKVIAIDAFFRGEKDKYQDSILASVLSKIQNFVMVHQLMLDNGKFAKLIHSAEIFEKYAQPGFANILITDDFQTVRSFSPKETINNQDQYAFSVETVRLFDSNSASKFLARDNSVEIINFRRNQDKYILFDVEDIFSNKRDLSVVKNKIVIFGFLGPDFSTLVAEDNFFTPMNEQYLGKTYPDMYGAIIHANCISMILSGDFINIIPSWVNLILLILIIYFNMAFYSYLRIRHDTLFEPLSISLVIIEAFFLFILMIIFIYFLKFSIYNNYYKAIFVSFIITPMTFETYHDSIKPLFISFYQNILLLFGRLNKR